MQIELIPIEKISPKPGNPRVIKDNKFRSLVKSIRDFPQMLLKRPLVVISQDGGFIPLGGNQRLRACQEIGKTEIPCIIADDFTEEQRKEFIIKDNTSSGEWDWDVLGNEWDEIKLEDWGMDLPTTKPRAKEKLRFFLTDEQKEIFNAAVDLAKSKKEYLTISDTYDNDDELGNALLLITAEYLKGNSKN